MIDKNKGKRYKCCLGLGIIFLGLGLLFGFIGSEGFGLPRILAIDFGVVLLWVGLKKSSLCKCYNKEEQD